METLKVPKLVEASETTSQEKEEKFFFIYFLYLWLEGMLSP